jgi:signal peptidase I
MYKHPWLAVFLSTVFPGAGQIYTDRKMRSIIFISITILLFLGMLLNGFLFFMSDDALVSRTALLAGLLCGIFLPLISLISIIDAYLIARKHNRRIGLVFEGKKKRWFSVFLSYLIPGVGQFYNGNVVKGVLFLLSLFVIAGISAYIPFLGLLMIPLYLYVLKDAHDTASRINESDERFVRQGTPIAKAFVIIIIVLSSIPITDLIKENVVQAFKFPSRSMLPTLLVGDHILTLTMGDKRDLASRGNIIVFKYPENREIVFAKRVLATQGDVIEGKNKVIYLNGKSLEEDYVQHTDSAILYERGLCPCRGCYGQGSQDLLVLE